MLVVATSSASSRPLVSVANFRLHFPLANAAQQLRPATAWCGPAHVLHPVRCPTQPSRPVNWPNGDHTRTQQDSDLHMTGGEPAQARNAADQEADQWRGLSAMSQDLHDRTRETSLRKFPSDAGDEKIVRRCQKLAAAPSSKFHPAPSSVSTGGNFLEFLGTGTSKEDEPP